jgi:hypothetical protein
MLSYDSEIWAIPNQIKYNFLVTLDRTEVEKTHTKFVNTFVSLRGVPMLLSKTTLEDPLKIYFQ